MSSQTALFVNFPVVNTSVLMRVFKDYIPRHVISDTTEMAFGDMLMCSHRGINHCTKGDIFSWAYIGNYIDLMEFIDAMTKLVTSLRDSGAISPCDRVVVGYQPEHDEFARIVSLTVDGIIECASLWSA